MGSVVQKESKLHFGLRMETLAAEWYLAKYPGSVLLQKNFRTRVGEIDLIFEEPVRHSALVSELVFIEVRARSAGIAWETGLESIRVPKQLRLVRTIQAFLARYRGPAKSARLDVMAWDGRSWTHVQNLRGLAGQVYGASY